MSVMNAELYRALKEAGASDDAATKAAESVAAYESKFAEVRADIAEVKGDLRLVKWMAGLSLAAIVAVIGVLVNLSIQVGRLTEAVTRIAS